MKVAKIIDKYTLAITKKGGEWVSTGDILCIGSQRIIDPETGQFIGAVPTLRVKVTEIHDKFVIAETYRIISGAEIALADIYPFAPPAEPVEVTVNIGDDVWPLNGPF